MSIKTQKIIRFIPIVNFISVFFWLKMVFQKNLPSNYIFKPMLKIAIPSVIIFIVRVIICETIDTLWITTLLTWMSYYITDLIFAFVAVKEQEKYYES